jgi:alkylhydroperoxidase family enzyme
MAWIETIDDGGAGDELKQLYDLVRDRVTNQVDEILRIHSLHPEGLAAHFQLYSSVMRGTRSLRKLEREMIALVVSQTNGCHY